MGVIRDLTMGCAAVAGLLASPAAAQESWNAAPWVEDFATMRQAFEAKYANRAWLEEDRGVDLDALFDKVAAILPTSGNDATARALLDQLIRRIDDGHVALRWDRPKTAATAATDAGRPADAAGFCRNLGYAAAIAKPGIADHLDGYAPLDEAGALPAGTVRIDGTTIGVLRVPIFMPEAFPDLCEAAVQQQMAPLDRDCDDQCRGELTSEVYAALTADLEQRLAALREAGATMLLVDLTNNGGGSEWAEAVARTLTARRLTSERLGFVRGPHWATQWGELAAKLHGWAKEASPADRARLLGWATEAEAAQRAAETPCERGGCERLGRAGYATGLVGNAAPDAFDGREWEPYVFSAGQFPYHEGVWDGPVMVLVDQETWSAAEEFAALLQDNRAATIVGGRTGGAGCGHTYGGTPTRLENSGAILKLPDCVRFRADGSNEVAGIVPDVVIGWRANDGTALRARLLTAALPAAIAEAGRGYAMAAR